MTSATTAKSAISRFPTPEDPAAVPAHLRGSHAAIFHLLRQTSASHDPEPQAVPPVARQTYTAAVKRVAKLSPSSIELRALIQEDQFEFLSVDVRGEALRSLVSSRNRLVS